MSDKAVSDPLYRKIKNKYSLTLPILGHPVTYGTNSSTVMGLVEQFHGRWSQLPSQYVSHSSFAISIVLHDGSEGDGLPEFVYRMPVPERLLIHTRGSHAVVEVDNQRAFAYVTADLVECSEHFRRGVLDAMTLMLLTSRDRCPFHAAALKINDRIVMLAGGSGSGKSTLSYALQSAGHDVVSDDTIYVQMDPEPRIWYMGEQITLLPSVARGFAELDEIQPKSLPTGKTKVVVPLRSSVVDGPSRQSPVVCVLQRGESASVERRSPSELHAMLSDGVEPGFDLLADQRGPALAWLTAQGGWQLNLSSRPADAIPLIEQTVSH